VICPADVRNARIIEHLEEFEQSIGLRFENKSLLLEALTHRSYVNEHSDPDAPDNQRLEFLGDAVLDLIVGEWLFRRYPGLKEGELTNARAHIVRTDALAALAREISLGDNLLLGRGELRSGGSEREANLCAALEALVGAAYLDLGLEDTRAWLRRILQPHAREVDEAISSRDAKSRLQELVQAVLHETPSYRIVREEGPDHAKVFTSQVVIGDKVWGEGNGSTKQAAEQAAASHALRAHGETLGDALFGEADLP